MRELHKRIAAMEGKLSTNPVTLHLPDGSRRTIRGDVKHWFSLCRAMSNNDAYDTERVENASHLDEELQAIKAAIRIDEPGGLFGLIWALENSPVAP